MNVSRRWFIGGAASFGAFQGCRFIESPFGRSGVARLKVGVVSDIHVIAEDADRPCQGDTRTFRHALRWFDAQGVDAVIVAGDMADNGLVPQLQRVADAWNAVFPNGRSTLDGRKVERCFIYGNHDYEGPGIRKVGEGANEREVNVLNLTVPLARQTFSNRVFRYELHVEADDAAGEFVRTRHILAPDYHLPLAKAPASFVIPVPEGDLPETGECRFSVTPVNCFGKAGEPLRISLSRHPRKGEWKMA